MKMLQVMMKMPCRRVDEALLMFLILLLWNDAAGFAGVADVVAFDVAVRIVVVVAADFVKTVAVVMI